MRNHPLAFGTLLLALTASAPLSAAQDGSEGSLQWLEEGDTFIRTKSYGEAIKVFEKALEADKKNFEILGRMALCHELLGKTDEAVGFLVRALEVRPDEADVNFRLGKAYLALGKAKEAVPPLEKAYAAKPELEGLKGALGKLYFAAGEYAKARDFLRKASKETPKDPEVWYDLGESLFRMERYDDAKVPLRKAAEVSRGDPKFQDLYQLADKRYRVAEARIPTFGTIEEGGLLFRNKAFEITIKKPKGPRWGFFFPSPLPERLVFWLHTDDDKVEMEMQSYLNAKGMTYTIGGMQVAPGQIKVLSSALETEFKQEHRDVKPIPPLRIPFPPQFKNPQTFAYTGIRKADLKKVDYQMTCLQEGIKVFRLRITTEAGEMAKGKAELEKILASATFPK
ncbi:MAG: tetratricopeptide repeat protein [Planctomycetales bacterium]|nr:tetratricopeptide repeat protein [Planctomycetales bacterium]